MPTLTETTSRQPWSIAEATRTGIIIETGGRSAAKLYTMDAAGIEQAPTERDIATARLIASAPDLLAALAGLLLSAQSQLDQSANHEGLKNCDRIARARRAIEAATGKELGKPCNH